MLIGSDGFTGDLQAFMASRVTAFNLNHYAAGGLFGHCKMQFTLFISEISEVGCTKFFNLSRWETESIIKDIVKILYC